MANKNKIDVLRVSQLDTEQIDNAIYNILVNEVKRSLNSEPFTYLLNFEPEINAVIRFILCKYSVSLLDATVGQTMLGTKYISEDRTDVNNQQKYQYFLVIVLLRWVKDRQRTFLKLLEAILVYTDRSDTVLILQRIISNADILFKVASFINFLLFLTYGGHVNLLERLLQLKHVYVSKPSPRYIDYEYMRKELIWESVLQTTFSLLPFVNVRKILNVGQRVLRYVQGSKPIGKEFNCAICLEKPTNPYNGLCNHVFCYFCIKGNILVDSNFTCPSCGEIISKIYPTEVDRKSL